MQRRDLGEIIGRYVYTRRVYSAHSSTYIKYNEECLLSSGELFSKLSSIYDRLGIEPLDEYEIDVMVKLPKSPNPIFREWWHETRIRKIDEKPVVMKIDKLVGYIERDVVLATKPWMRSFEVEPGNKVVISPCVPLPSTAYSFR